LPGSGFSSPVVWGDRVFLWSAAEDNSTRFVLCYSARDGRQLWMREFPAKKYSKHQRNSYAASTPAVDNQHLYVAWATPDQLEMRAFDHDGNVVWHRELGRWVGQHGFGTSPIIHEGLVILHNAQDGEPEGIQPGWKPGEDSMVALDRRTGKDVWKTPLTTTRVCYSTPFIYQPEGGAAQIICTNTGNGVFSLDAASGRMNWSVKNAFSMRVVNSPITAGGLIFGSTGSGAYSGNYLVAVRPGPQAEIAYQLKSSNKIKPPYVTCMIPKDNYVFLIYDRGFAACLDAPTGSVRWLERTDGSFSGSPVRAGDNIYDIDEDGVVWVFAADPDRYRLLGKNPLGEPSRSTPAISGGRIFFRTLSHLYCVGAKETAAAGS
jgi:outer membrane protein assembly factor BamB